VCVALRGADRHPSGCRDFIERNVERVFQADNPRLSRRQLCQAPAELPPRLGGCQLADRVGVGRNAQVLIERLRSALGRPASLRHVLAGVHHETMQPRPELRLAAKLAEPGHDLRERFLRGVVRVLRIAQNVQRDLVRARRVALAERLQCLPVSVFCSAHEDRVGQLLVDERPVRPKVSRSWTDATGWGLHRTIYFRDVRLTSDLVLPALRGSYGREYRHADIAPTTQQMLPESAVHGSVALAEHQTAGRGRLGRVWNDEAGAGLMFSVALYPPPPVFAWPELTLVAANAVADAVGEGATIKHPNDVLLEGRKVAGILAEASSRVILGIGVNVGKVPWPDAGCVDRDRLDLLVDILERLERGYDAWAGA
jgi:hypothetical protein